MTAAFTSETRNPRGVATMVEPDRAALLKICARAFVPQENWQNRDSADAQRQLGEAYALLKAGCDFMIVRRGDLASDTNTLWVRITYQGFDYFEYGEGSESHETFYLPTAERLRSVKGGDWY